VDYHVNEFYLLDGEKFSTSRRHAIWGKDLLTPQTVDAVRYYLAKTRPETSRTNFTLAGYQAAVDEILVGTWQRWLNDLGERVGRRYGGTVPDAGIWTPEHTAFLARLEGRLAQMAGCLGQDGFSLNRAAGVLDGIVADALAFSAAEQHVAGMPDWADESRTAIALELAAARLLACCAAPVMPRFAGRLAAALGVPEPAQWPELVALVPPGTRCGLAGQAYFGAAEPEPEPPLLPWLSGLVRQTLRLAQDEQVANATLVGLGVESLQAIALQYQILERTGAEVPVDDLLGDKTVTQLAVSLAAAGQEAGLEEGAVLA
jgi:methionyl-tRNA synthetase